MSEEHKEMIDNMGHYEMAYMVRFAPTGHPFFISGTETSEYFYKKFNKFGGMTTEISKRIGWGKRR